MESYVISDGQISASSQWDNNHAAIQGRLNFKAGSGKRGGWSSKLNDVNQWLQIDLGDPNTDVTGLATQGRNAHSQWVTKYKMQYSVDGINFQYYVEQGAEKVICLPLCSLVRLSENIIWANFNGQYILTSIHTFAHWEFW